jgi:hypothetical protein
MKPKSTKLQLKARESSPLSVPNLELPSALWHPRWLKPSAWVEHLPFAFWMMQVLRPQRFVELGTHFGTSYFAFCQAAERLEIGCESWAVDTWKGDEHAGFYGEEIYEQVRAHNAANYAAFSSLIRSTFDEALPYFTDGTIDLLHIDGHHSFDSVRHDFESWLPKLSECAVVLFHDTNVKERHFGVGRFFDTLKLQYPWFVFPHGHGLGVIGVGKTQTPLLRRLFELGADSSESKSLRNIFGRLGHACSVASEAEKLKEEKSHLSARCTEHQRELDSTRAALSDVQGLAASRLDQIGDLSRRMQTAVEHSATLRGEWAERVTALTESKEEMAKAHARELALSESLVQELKKKLEEATNRELSLLDSHGHLQEKSERLANENARLREEAIQQREKLKSLESEVDRLSRLISDMETTLSSRAETLAFKSQALADTLMEKNRISAEHQEAERQIADLHSELVRRDERIAEQDRECHSLRDTLNQQALELTRLMQSENERTAIGTFLQATVNNLQKANDSISAELDSARAQNQLLADELQQSRQASEEAVAKLERERDSLQANVDERFRELAQLAKMMLERDDKIASQEQALASEHAEKLALSEQLSKADKQRSALERERDSLQANVDERFRELAQLAQMLMQKDVAIEDSRATAAKIKASVSWKLTRPIRWLGNSFGNGAKEKKRFQRLCSIIEQSGLFDVAWYKDTYPDVAQAGLNPIEHYLRHGAREGRNPSPRFHTQNYLRRYPDVAKENPPINPLLHYVLHGKKEGRIA